MDGAPGHLGREGKTNAEILELRSRMTGVVIGGAVKRRIGGSGLQEGTGDWG